MKDNIISLIETLLMIFSVLLLIVCWPLALVIWFIVAMINKERMKNAK